MKLSLNNFNWTLRGWNKNQWTYMRTMETGVLILPPIPPMKATVPGGIISDLLNAGYIEDYNYGLKTMNIEWIENREWSYQVDFLKPENSFDRCVLCFDGLDYSGCVLLNNHLILNFEGTHLPWRVDITDYLSAENNLKVVFYRPPDVDGQTGHTSRTKILKPRFNYIWDWCPRIINSGIWQDVYLHVITGAGILDFYPKTSLNGTSGKIAYSLKLDVNTPGEYEVEIEVVDNSGKCLATHNQKTNIQHAGNPVLSAKFDVNDVKLWWPNGMGEQPLYDVNITLKKEGETCDTNSKQVGFKKIEYKQNPGSPEDSLNYTIVINDKPVFIKGINWVPPSPNYGTVTEEQYRENLIRFRDMKLNIIRVWGGAILEKDAFYRICDEYGIMVWQDFPQSSSGIDNTPCEEKDFIDNMVEVATDYIRRRRHHVSLAVWCGGNELYYHNYTPVDLRSQNLAALNEVVKQHHPECMFLPATPSGQIDCMREYEIGKGKHGDTHGPWDYLGSSEHYRLFNIDDSLLKSEVGSPGTARYENLVKFSDGMALWPPDNQNRYWTHRGSWWIRDKELTQLFGDFEEDVDEYTRAFRYLQSESIGYSCEVAKRNAPRQSGIIVWMGNEPFPNTCNTSLIEYDLAAKPAYHKLRKVFANFRASTKYEKIGYKSGESFEAEIHLSSADEKARYDVEATILTATGEVLLHKSFENVSAGMLEKISMKLAENNHNAFVMRLEAKNGKGEINLSEYAFTVNSDKAFEALRKLPKANLEVEFDEDKCEIKNVGDVAVIGLFALGKSDNDSIINLANDREMLLPGEVTVFEKMHSTALTLDKVIIEALNFKTTEF